MIDTKLLRRSLVVALLSIPIALVAQGPAHDTTQPRMPDTAVHYQGNTDTPAALDAAHSLSPQYPHDLVQARIAGAVRAQFVVDTLGHAEMATFKVMNVVVDVSRLPPANGNIADTAANTRQITEASKQLFAQAVQNALPKMQFVSARVGGHPVRQLVVEQFNFTAR